MASAIQATQDDIEHGSADWAIPPKWFAWKNPGHRWKQKRQGAFSGQVTEDFEMEAGFTIPTKSQVGLEIVRLIGLAFVAVAVTKRLVKL